MRVKKSNLPIIVVVALILITVVVAIILSRPNKKMDYSSMSDEEIKAVVDEKITEMKKEDLSKLGERDRMEKYVTSFITAVESKNYEGAYEMLYDEFKEKYFPSISDFEEYAKRKFPSNMSLKYTNIERNGDTYVLWVTLSSLLAGKNSGIEMNFVVRENDLNNFDLSFTVI